MDQPGVLPDRGGVYLTRTPVLLALVACGDGPTPAPRPLPVLPSEQEFILEHARLACRWAEACGIAESMPEGADCREIMTSFSEHDDPTFNARTLAWIDRCHAVYDPFRAAECLRIWQDNGVDCTVSFYSGCAAGDWYEMDVACR